ncbi:HD domain-containing protein [Candidatus Gracilibacteria bacterium]|nr:HD domain-containing protein [Candidatus Gracilibacteria bacterium]
MNKLATMLDRIAAFCAQRGVPAWLVGGSLRDLLLGYTPHDLDVAVDGDGTALARAFADATGGAFVALDDTRSTARVVLPLLQHSEFRTQDPEGAARLVVDFARLRGACIAHDLAARDFTLNALALPLFEDSAFWLQDSEVSAHGVLAERPIILSVSDEFSAALIDPLGGLNDLRAGRLRPCAATSMSDDPLRMLRAVRLAAVLGLAIDPALDRQIRVAAAMITAVAGERVRDELLKLLDTPNAARWLRYLDDTRVLTQLIPELEAGRDCEQPHVHVLPVLAHILETVRAVEWLQAQLPQPAPSDDAPLALGAQPDLAVALPYADALAALMVQPRAQGVRRGALLKLAALLHDVAKPQTKELHPDGKVSFYGHQDIGAEIAGRVGRRLGMSRPDISYVQLVVREHMRPGQLRTADVLTRRALVRFFRDCGDAGPDVLLHELADHLATRGQHVDANGWQAHLAWTTHMLDGYYIPAVPAQEPLLRGDELIAALGIAPGPLVGRMLREIDEARAAGEITSRAEALVLARRMREESGDTHQGAAAGSTNVLRLLLLDYRDLFGSRFVVTTSRVLIVEQRQQNQR